jgi:hypothetical protein
MNFPEEAERERQGFQALDPVFQGGDVIRDLAEIRRAPLHAGAGLHGQQLA